MAEGADSLREAAHYKRGEGGAVRCALCPNGCALADGAVGLCLARQNIGGVLRALNYGVVSSIALDPIEKKPLRHFHPGSYVLSVGSFGCNLKCPFCQNHSISTALSPHAVQQAAAHAETAAHAAGARVHGWRAYTPQELVDAASRLVGDGNIGIAYTYNEPMVWHEFVLDAARLASSNGLANVLVTNGYVNRAPLEELLPHISAMNVDLKGDDAFYREMCGGRRPPVEATIRAAHAAGCHVEVTFLLVAGRNDSLERVDAIAEWVASVSPEIPLHLSRCFPAYRMAGAGATDARFVLHAAEAAGARLRHVYTGNV